MLSGEPSLKSVKDLYHVLDALPGAVCAFRPGVSSDTPMFMNQAFLKIAGAKSERDVYEGTGGDFRAFLCPGDADIVRDCNDRICKSIGASLTYECRVYTLQKTVRLIRVHATSMKSEDGEILIVNFVMDLGTEAGLTAANELDRQTGLITMHSFFSVMEDWKKRGGNFGQGKDLPAVLFINLTNFRMVNLKAGIRAGDALIAGVGKSLREYFRDGVVSHFDGDHFAVLTWAFHAGEKAEGVRSLIRMIGQNRIDCSIGICVWDDLSLPAETVCNRAKIASDANRRKVGTPISFYTKQMGDQLEIADYVVSNIDEAVSKGWIQVYYQPVIRAISGQLCGMEALARWIDPVRGFLAPDRFIGPLEESQKIARLDLCVIEQVIRTMAEREKQSLPEIPVSVNLSRIDFLTCDIVEEIEKLVRRYDVPRRMLHLEVTESTLTSKEEAVFMALDRFRAAGYEIWMDDFGSGYSTLNLLKDYSFDVLKIDMIFLRKDTPRSRAIIESVVAMDKKIRNRSLAEGVETTEQVEFLKKCGCEKLQGYYFGKPQPFEEALKTCEEKGITVESAKKKNFFDALEFVDFMTAVPLTLAELDRGRIRMLFANDPAMELIRKDFPSLEALEESLNDEKNPADRELRKAAAYAIGTGSSGEVYTPFNGRERRLHYRLLSGSGDDHLFEVTIHERLLSNGQLSKKREAILSLRFIYRYLFIIDPKEGKIENVQFSDLSDGQNGAVPLVKDKRLTSLLPAVFPADAERYEAFLDPATLGERVSRTKDGILRGTFRIRSLDGSYIWTVHRILYVPNSGDRTLLYAIRVIDTGAEEYEEMYRRRDPYRTLMRKTGKEDEKSALWDNLMLNVPVPFFLMDSRKKLVGASRSFLSYFGVSSAEEYEERTERDMGWNPASDLAKGEAQEVLETGESLVNVPGSCVAGGVTHACATTRWPVYQDGRVSGIMGYFLDETMTGDERSAMTEQAGRDPVSGLDTMARFLENLGMYESDYRTRQKTFGIILIDIPELPRIGEQYGKQALFPVVKACSDAIRKALESRGPAARLALSRFGAILSCEDKEDLRLAAEKIRQAVDAIHRVGEVTCTFFAETRVLYADEACRVLDNLFPDDREDNDVH